MGVCDTLFGACSVDGFYCPVRRKEYFVVHTTELDDHFVVVCFLAGGELAIYGCHRRRFSEKDF
jgi:hypothetical protein